MAKKKEKGKEKKGKRVRKGPTITKLVLAYLDKHPDAETKEIYDHIVANGFPKTKFNKNHLSWYKYQVRKGKLSLPSGKTLPPSKRGRKKKTEKVSKKSGKKTKKVKRNKD